MIANKPGAGGGYIQSGFGREYGGSPMMFSEDNPDGGETHYERHLVGSLAYVTTHQFWEQFVFGPGNCAGGAWRENVDTTVVHQMTRFCPFAIWSAPFSPQFAGEALNLEDDIPATASAGMLFFFMQTQSYSNQFSAYLPPMLAANTEPQHNDNPGSVGSDSRGRNFTVYTSVPH